MSKPPKILVTGAAGFIGFHLIQGLLSKTDWQVVGLDNLNSYYDPNLKLDRLRELNLDVDLLTAVRGPVQAGNRFAFYRMDMESSEAIDRLFESEKPDMVINLAAQAGVRYSLEAPRSYIKSNVSGFLNILEGCRTSGVKHLIYASSSSVYGLNTKVPFSTADPVDHPVSLYAASKRSNELMAHTYSHLFNIPTTGLRFFTVYGPYGRPDMAYFHFTRRILAGQPIRVFNHGKMRRDFTYVEDVVNGIIKLLEAPVPAANGTEMAVHKSSAPFALYNIGNNKPVELMEFIQTLEDLLGKKAVMQFEDMQAGDIVKTYADIDDLYQLTGFRPKTDLRTGLAHFVNWYKSYYL
ncbi:MAG: NAD-dependent epimerase [Saprospiraceae bacterium]|nr:NAD-dependent epimerase [Saprospiraceae bacterium]